MYDEREVQSILRRAIELDAARPTRFTTEELLEVGAELGVSRTALLAAMSESESSDRMPPMAAWRLGIAGAAAGLIGSVINNVPLVQASLSMPAVIILSLGIFGGVVMSSGALAISRTTRSILHYLLRNGALWAGFGLGAAAVRTLLVQIGVRPWPGVSLAEIASMTLVGGAVTALAGAAFIVVRGQTAKESGDTGDNSQSVDALPRVRIRGLARRMLDFLTQPISYARHVA